MIPSSREPSLAAHSENSQDSPCLPQFPGIDVARLADPPIHDRRQGDRFALVGFLEVLRKIINIEKHRISFACCRP